MATNWLHLAGLFVFALEIPFVSPAALTVVATVSGIRLLRMPTSLGFLWRGGLLALALTLHFLIAVGHGFVEPLHALARTFLALAAYTAGYWAGHGRDDGVPGVRFGGALAAVFGSVLFAILSVRLGLARGELDLVGAAAAMDRWAPSPWGGERGINAPGLGALGSLGMVLMPAVVFSANRAWNSRQLLRCGIAIAVIAGAVSNLLLQNRTPFIALAAATLIGLFLFLRSSEVSWARKAVTVSMICGGAVTAAILALTSLSRLGVFERFEAEGLKTARYDLWRIVLSDVFQHPDGGRVARLTESYAHNLWLDMAWDSGPFPFLMMLAFHASHAVAIATVIRRSSLTTSLIVAGLIVAFLATCMAEPVLYVSIGYFTLTCYTLGVILASAEQVSRRPV